MISDYNAVEKQIFWADKLNETTEPEGLSVQYSTDDDGEIQAIDIMLGDQYDDNNDAEKLVEAILANIALNMDVAFGLLDLLNEGAPVAARAQVYRQLGEVLKGMAEERASNAIRNNNDGSTTTIELLH